MIPGKIIILLVSWLTKFETYPFGLFNKSDRHLGGCKGFLEQCKHLRKFPLQPKCWKSLYSKLTVAKTKLTKPHIKGWFHRNFQSSHSFRGLPNELPALTVFSLLGLRKTHFFSCNLGQQKIISIQLYCKRLLWSFSENIRTLIEGAEPNFEIILILEKLP